MTCKRCFHFKKTDPHGGYCKNTIGNKEVKLNFSCPFFGNTAQPSVIPKHSKQPVAEQFEPSRKEFLYTDEEPSVREPLVTEPLCEPEKELPNGNEQNEM